MIRAQLPFEFGQLAFRDFAGFEPGANAEALSLVRRAASGEALHIFVHGPRGTGKTHLLSAACEAARTRGASVVYLPLVALVERGAELIDGLGERDLVCVDEFHACVGVRAWERAMFNVYNACDETGGSFVAAASTPAQSLEFELPDLGSRMRGALSVALSTLDDEARAGAIQRLALTAGFDIPLDVTQYLLRRAPRDMHSLARLVESLDRASLSAQRRITVPFVRDWLASGAPPQACRPS